MTEEFNKWWDSDAVTRDASYGRWDADNIPKNNPYSVDTPVYWAWEGWQAALKVKREWQGLTDGEIDALHKKDRAWPLYSNIARDIEAKLKEKNT